MGISDRHQRHLNTNSLRNKTEAVEELMRNNIDISLFSETELQSVTKYLRLTLVFI